MAEYQRSILLLLGTVAGAKKCNQTKPDEIHKMGLEQVAELHGRMDVILKKLGYSQGTVGARMTALSNDPRYKFAEGDPGRGTARKCGVTGPDSRLKRCETPRQPEVTRRVPGGRRARRSAPP